MTLFPQLLTLSDVAGRLGVPLHTLYRNMSSLRACGFPRPVPGCGRRYDPEAVATWLARQRPQPEAVPSEPPAETPAVTDIAGWQAELSRRLEAPPSAA